MISTWEYESRIFAYLREDQIPDIVDMLHDPEAEKYLWFAPITVEGFGAYVSPLIKQQKDDFAEGRYPDSASFSVTEHGELLGVCGISRMPDGHNVAMVGYQFRRSAWGRGVATSSLEFVLHYAKTYLSLRKLFGDCVAANVDPLVTTPTSRARRSAHRPLRASARQGA